MLLLLVFLKVVEILLKMVKGCWIIACKFIAFGYPTVVDSLLKRFSWEVDTLSKGLVCNLR
jgi:hypothetical protein